MILPKYIVEAAIIEHRALSPDSFLLRVNAPLIAVAAESGQFVEVAVPNGAFILRRPLGVAGVSPNGDMTLIYRTVGSGTKSLANAKVGDVLSIVGPLGKGFSKDYERPLLVGGGVGLSPLLFYAERQQPAAVLMGGRNRQELFWEKLYKPYAAEIFITSDDGSIGTKGFVTTLLPELLAEGKYDAVVVCGPDIMMKRVADIAKEYNLPCEVSLERRMACGLGACLSCSVDSSNGRRKVCKDGPVFRAEEVFL